jgi:RAD54-like protein 2
MPINTLQNWLAEFNMWMPAESPANGDAEPGMEVRPRNFGLFLLNDSQKTLTARAKVRNIFKVSFPFTNNACAQVIRQWRNDGGVLLIGYELYRLLSLRRDKLSKKKKFINLIDIEDEGNRKKALWSGMFN